MHHCFMMSCLLYTKKKYGQIFGSKDKNWRQKDDCKSQKNLNFRLDQPQQ